MRKINSDFRTQYMSEEGQRFANRDYFGYVEMDDFACYVLADSLDNDPENNSARFVVESIIRCFVERPSMSKGSIRKYIRTAHRELLKEHKGMRLKAAVAFVVTDYRKIRYSHVGNCRIYLMRNGRYLLKTRDHSLTQNLVQENEVTKDQAAVHEERNNLYSYLGERGEPKIQISKKVTLLNGDILTQLTRGVWEQLSDEELLETSKDATEPKEILERAEDIILGKQEEPGEIDNYTLAVTFIDKVYKSPKKKISVKTIIMIAIPVLLLAGGIGLGVYMRHRNIKNKQESLARYMVSGEEYLKYDNYKKASEEYTEAKKLAASLKKKEDLQESDQYLKLAEQILLADEAMLSGEYQKAQDLYLTARGLSVDAGNVGKKYIDSQLEQTKSYIDVYDLIKIGEEKENYGDIEGAITAYKQAREKSASLYFATGKEEALKKQTSAEEKLSKDLQQKEAAREAALLESQEAAQKEEAAKKEQEDKEKESKAQELELENQQKANDQQSAIELENKGNELLAEGKYESAITYYQTAQAIYIRLELPQLADGINGKIAAAQAGIDARDVQESSTGNAPVTGPGAN